MLTMNERQRLQAKILVYYVAQVQQGLGSHLTNASSELTSPQMCLYIGHHKPRVRFSP